jgi:hypothetical protein
MKKITWLFAAVFFAMTGCVSIESSSISGSPNGVSGTPVHVSEEGDFGILHLSSPTDLTTKADQDLMSQCSSGHLSNVQTQLSIRDWFLIVQVYKVRATAICQ